MVIYNTSGQEVIIFKISHGVFSKIGAEVLLELGPLWIMVSQFKETNPAHEALTREREKKMSSFSKQNHSINNLKKRDFYFGNIIFLVQ